MRKLGLLLILLLPPVLGLALEKASPEAMRRRATSTLDENSARPLYLFAMRGRPDPFIPFFFTSIRREKIGMAISELSFTGFVGAGPDAVALFSHRASGTTYTLKGSQLYSTENVPLEDVRGRVLPSREVRLQQGNRAIIFSTFKGRSR